MAKKNKVVREQQMPEAVMEQEVAEELVEFEAWHAVRRHQIPAHHHKEIIKADFRGRGLSNLETMSDFDEALEKYGIKLA